MTRKDYQLIADAIAETRSECSGDGCTASISLTTLAENLSTRLRADNPRFDRSRFLKASGV